MKRSTLLRHWMALLAILTLTACFCAYPQAGQPAAQAQAAAKPAAEPAGDAADDEPPPKPRDLGPPLVDDIKALRRLDPAQAVWLDPKNKQVVLLGEACKATYPLEFFATLRGRDYESVVVVDVRPSIVHAGLLAVGAEPGHPARFEPKFEPPTGTEVQIDVRWKDRSGKRQQARAQELIRNIKTKKMLDVNWVFAGSGFWVDETTGKKMYQGDSGDFISVLNLPTATLDLPVRSFSAIESRLFEGNPDRLPPEGTPVTIILTPKPAKPKKADRDGAATKS